MSWKLERPLVSFDQLPLWSNNHVRRYRRNAVLRGGRGKMRAINLDRHKIAVNRRGNVCSAVHVSFHCLTRAATIVPEMDQHQAAGLAGNPFGRLQGRLPL